MFDEIVRLHREARERREAINATLLADAIDSICRVHDLAHSEDGARAIAAEYAALAGGSATAVGDWDEPQSFGYHTPDCAITAEDNCTCDLYDRIAAERAEAARAAVQELRAEIEEIFPAIARYGDRHTPDCSTIRYPGSTGPDPEPPDPCSCGGPAVLALLEPTNGESR